MRYALILAGGVGSRFWPLSRKSLPKQFLQIMGQDSLLNTTIRRIREVVPDRNIFIITNQLHLERIKKQSRGFKIPSENIILEPKPLNTLPAISACAQIINLRDEQANLLVLPSDHYIKDEVKFRHIVSETFRLAEIGFLCLIGIKPDTPCTGYGYIKAGKKIKSGSFYVRYFKEKPDLKQAKRLIREKDIFWNSGIFCFKTEVVLREIRTYQPRLYTRIIKIRDRKDIEYHWNKIKPISIDYGLLEKSRNLVMVTAKFYWRDLGSWDALCDVLPKDKKNNIILADSLNLDSMNTLIYSQDSKRLIATIGLKDLVIVDTPDALLVCKKERSQEIKKLVEVLKKKRKSCV